MVAENEKLIQQMIEYRARENISAVELARRCKLTSQTVYSIESGKQTPSRVTRQKILNVIKKED